MNRIVAFLFYILLLSLLSSCANKDLSLRFTSNKDATVLDKETGLMWAAYDSGGDITWKEATEYCQSYQGGGYSDWRMPRKDELISLQNAGIERSEKKARTRMKNNPIQLSDRGVWSSDKKGTEAAFCDFRFDKKKCAWMEQYISVTLRALPVRNNEKKMQSTSETMSSEQIADKLKMIKQMYKDDLLTKEEYDQKRKELVDQI
jgi:hypothetical protein